MLKSRGAVALEFLFIFPMVVAMLYAAATYGVLFFSKYEMQSAVDRAVATALRIDRNRYSEADLGAVLVNTACAIMPEHVEYERNNRCEACKVIAVGDLELLNCSLTLSNGKAPIVPQLSFGFLGRFPPMPESITVEASIAF